MESDGLRFRQVVAIEGDNRTVSSSSVTAIHSGDRSLPLSAKSDSRASARGVHLTPPSPPHSLFGSSLNDWESAISVYDRSSEGRNCSHPNSLTPPPTTPTLGLDPDPSPAFHEASGQVAASPPSRASLDPSGGGDHPYPSRSPFDATIEERQRIFGHNILPPRAGGIDPSEIHLVPKEINLAIVLWSVAIVLFLTFSLFLGFGTTLFIESDPVDWIGVITTVAAVLVIVLARLLSDQQNARHFERNHQNRKGNLVEVLRNGSKQHINIQDVVVGDVVLLQPGEVVPCDGVFLSGHNVLCDESTITGHADEIMKAVYEDCIVLDRRFSEIYHDNSEGDGAQRDTNSFGTGHGIEPPDQDCFLVGGSKVLAGTGSYVVTSVGEHCLMGRITMALRGGPKRTPLQLKLDDIVRTVSKVVLPIVKVYFCAFLVFLLHLCINRFERSQDNNAIALIQIFMSAVIGLPFVVGVNLAFSKKRMTRENIFVRSLEPCETMANASVICADKTGTLTQNEMTVVVTSVGIYAKFFREPYRLLGGEARSGPNLGTFDPASDLSSLNLALAPELAKVFHAAIVFNTTAFEDLDPETGAVMFTGSKTDMALLKFTRELCWANIKHTREATDIVQMIPFSNDRRSIGCVVQLPHGGHRLYIRGASELLTKECTRYVVVYRDVANGATNGNGVETAPIGKAEGDSISCTIKSYASHALRTIAFCYRDFSHWPPSGARVMDSGEVEYDDLATDLTLIGIVGIEDPLREGVQGAVANCNQAGVRVMMCTGDNLLTALSIAQQCGIYTPGGIVMNGPSFRALSADDVKAIAPQLQVLARCTPEDKRVLVEMLKELGETVCVAGDGTNDGPALDAAHVGVTMGIAGTEVTEEASNIVLMDDHFPSIVEVIVEGRRLNEFTQKLLQFQIPAKVAITIATLVSPLLPSPVLSAAQLLWVLTIVDVFSPLALATEPATPTWLKPRQAKTSPLFTVNTTKHVLGQSTYQIAILLLLPLFLSRIPGHQDIDDPGPCNSPSYAIRALVFNTFVFAQIFNTLNSRHLDGKLNVFEGVSSNWRFMLIASVEVALHVVLWVFAGDFLQVACIRSRDLVISFAIGLISLPLGALIRLIPNEPCERVFKVLGLLPPVEAESTTAAEGIT